MTKCGCETGTNCTTITVCQCELTADKLYEALEALVVDVLGLVVPKMRVTLPDVLKDAQAALKEYRDNAA